MNENITGPTFPLPQPLIAPLGVKVTPAMVQEVWDTFVKPTQSNDAPPQSIEMRALMGILRAVHAALEAGPIPAETLGPRAVIELTAKVERVEALADDMDHDADLLDQTDDLRLHLIAATHREDATRLRTALNGDDR